MYKIKGSVIRAAIDAANNLRATADRLCDAAERGDFARLSEIQLSSTTWTVDQVRGAALVILRAQEETK